MNKAETKKRKTTEKGYCFSTNRKEKEIKKKFYCLFLQVVSASSCGVLLSLVLPRTIFFPSLFLLSLQLIIVILSFFLSSSVSFFLLLLLLCFLSFSLFFILSLSLSLSLSLGQWRMLHRLSAHATPPPPCYPCFLHNSAPATVPCPAATPPSASLHRLPDAQARAPCGCPQIKKESDKEKKEKEKKRERERERAGGAGAGRGASVPCRPMRGSSSCGSPLQKMHMLATGVRPSE